MERVIVLGLSGCGHCEALVDSLKKENVSFKFIDADENEKLADRMEAALKVDVYPMVILEDSKESIYLFRTDTIKEAKATSIGIGTKVGCVSIDNMVAIIKKHLK